MSFHYTVESNKTIEEVIKSLEKNLKDYHFGIQWQTSITENLKNKGFTKITTPYHILEVCSPGEAEQVLSQNHLGHYFMPCKITVYKHDGKTKIGLPKPSSLLGMLDDAELMKMAVNIDNQLIEVLDKSK